MYHTLLVPLDGSGFGEHALHVATALARRSGAALELVRVHRMDPYAVADGRLDEQLHQDEAAYLTRVAEQVRQELGTRPAAALLEGDVVDAICDRASALDRPLIVMSTHGRTGLSRVWLGSVADAVMRRATLPVLMLRPADESGATPIDAAFRRILVPVDGSDFAELALRHALSLAHATAAGIVLLTVVEPMAPPPPELPVPYVAPGDLLGETLQRLVQRADAYLENLTARLRHDNPTLDIVSEVRIAASPATEILERAVGYEADVVALATHGRGFSRLMIGSVADKVVRAGPGATLLVRPAHD